MITPSNSLAKPLPLNQILLCGAVIVTLSMGIRHGFGLWLQPIAQAHGWARGDVAFAFAIQNLLFGFFGIFAGMAADRFGAMKVILACAVIFSLGLAGMAWSPTPLAFMLCGGVLVGLALAGTTYAVVFGVIGRNCPAEKRAWAMSIAAAAGSFGQFLMVPLETQLILNLGWDRALYALAGVALLIIPFARGLFEPNFSSGSAPKREQSVVQALRESFAYPSFQLLMAGYFVCGFQLAFIGVHLPSDLKDKGLSPQVAGYALGLIGLFNVFGTYAVGVLGARIRKPYILSGIYALRALAIGVFLLLPVTPASVYVFASVMGLLWLSTVPVTNATVAQIFGVAHLSMLSGFVFFSHQIGSFLGVWLGGVLYDRTGSYDVVWAIAIGLGVLAALVNLPIKEGAILRPSSLAGSRAG